MRPFPIHFILSVSAVLLTGSCGKSDKSPQPDLPPPHISSFTPAGGTKDISVTIGGDHFANSVTDNQVTFNGRTAVVISASPASLVVKVPADAGIGKIRVRTAGGTDSSAANFMYAETPDTTAGTSVITLAGDGSLSQLGLPAGIAVDAAGTLYVADANNDRIRKITPAGVITTLAGMPISAFADGDATHARFNHPAGVAVDAAGIVYVADLRNHRIRRITPQGDVNTLAGDGIPLFANGTGTQARFNAPTGIAIDAAGILYVADADNNRIRKIMPGGIVSTLAGSGVPGFADGADSVAQFNYPTGVAVDTLGNVFVADANNHRIRKVTPAGVVSTLAGSGDQGFANNTGLLAKFNYPTALAVDVSGNIYVADNNNHRIRKITTARVVSTVAGTGVAGFADGRDTVAQFNFPDGIAIGPSGALYIGDQWNNRIRKITLHP